jgi:hypothetical protein
MNKDELSNWAIGDCAIEKLQEVRLFQLPNHPIAQSQNLG